MTIYVHRVFCIYKLIAFPTHFVSDYVPQDRNRTLPSYIQLVSGLGAYCLFYTAQVLRSSLHDLWPGSSNPSRRKE